MRSVYISRWTSIWPTIVVKVKQNRKKYRKWNRNKHILNPDICKVNPPTPIQGRRESFADRQHRQLYISHLADMHKTREKDDGQRRPVVLEEDPDMMFEQRTASNDTTKVRHDEDQQRNDDRQVKRGFGALASQDLDSFLQEDEGNVEAKGIAGKARHVFQSVASVGDGENPVHSQRPSAFHQRGPRASYGKESDLQSDQSHKGKVIGACGNNDVVDSTNHINFHDQNHTCVSRATH